MMYVGWEDDPYKLTEWPEEWQKAYLEECPPLDPQRSRASRKWSILFDAAELVEFAVKWLERIFGGRLRT